MEKHVVLRRALGSERERQDRETAQQTITSTLITLITLITLTKKFQIPSIDIVHGFNRLEFFCLCCDVFSHSRRYAIKSVSRFHQQFVATDHLAQYVLTNWTILIVDFPGVFDPVCCLRNPIQLRFIVAVLPAMFTIVLFFAHRF